MSCSLSKTGKHRFDIWSDVDTEDAPSSCVLRCIFCERRVAYVNSTLALDIIGRASGRESAKMEVENLLSGFRGSSPQWTEGSDGEGEAHQTRAHEEG